MKKFYLSLFAGIVYSGLSGQVSPPPSVQWITQFNGQQSETETTVKSVKDANGFYYVLANTGSDVLITKFDNSGAAVNSFRYNEPSNNTNSGTDIKTDAAGNIYVCGGSFITSQWNWMPTVVKLSPGGAKIWEQIIPCAYYMNNDAFALALDNNNNVYTVGANSDTMSVAFISASGNLVWEKKIVPAGYTIGEAYDVVVDASNNAYVTGKVMNAAGNYDLITFKINSAGTILWSKFLSGIANADDSGLNIEIDASGNSFVSGIIADSSSSNVSALLVKYNASGGQQWVKKLHVNGQTEALPGDHVLDASGNCYIAVNHHTSSVDGYTRVSKFTSAGVVSYATSYSDASFNRTSANSVEVDAAGNAFIGGTKVTGCCVNDIFAAKFNGSGVNQWAQNYNSASYDQGITIMLDNGNNAVIAGNGSAAGISQDIVLVKFSAAGIFQWDGFYNASGNPSDQNVEVFTQGNYSIYSLGTVSNESSLTDVLLSKYDNMGNILWQNVLDYNAAYNTARDMDHDANFNISILADASTTSSIVSSFDSIGSPIFTTYLNAGYLHTSMVQDNTGNIYTAGGSVGTKDFCVAKLNAAGSVLVQTSPASASSWQANPVDIDIDNNSRFYVFGHKFYDKYGAGAYKKFLLQRYTAAGSLSWSVDVSGVDSTGSYTDLDYYWSPKKLLVDNNNSYVLFNGKPNGQTNYGAIVIKYNATGVEQWRLVFNNNDTYGEEAVDIDFGPNNTLYILTNRSAQGNLYRADRTTGSIIDQNILTSPGHNLTFTAMNYGAASGEVYAIARGFSNSYDGNIVLVKADSACNQIWSTNAPADYPGDDWPTDVSMTATGRIYVSAGMVMHNGTGTDAALVKFCDVPANTLVASGATQNLCPGNSVELYAGSADSYEWNVPNETDSTLNISTAGMYYATTYKPDGCWKNTDTIFVTLKNPPVAPEICQVTVDTASMYNIVYWDNSQVTDADSVRIYREDVTNVYTYIGSVSVNDAGEFIDTVADPNVTTKRYKISAVDSCGNESPMSSYHNTIYIVYNGLGQFSWNPLYTIEGSANPVNNYVLMRDDNGNGNWTQIASTAGTQNTIVDPNYNGYPAGKWRVETIWNISCDPNRAIINTSRSNIKANLAGPSLGVEEQTAITLAFSPNPFSDETRITVSANGSRTEGTFELFDETGRLVRTVAVSTSTFILEKGSLSAGIYFYSMTDRNGKQAKGKLIIQN